MRRGARSPSVPAARAQSAEEVARGLARHARSHDDVVCVVSITP